MSRKREVDDQNAGTYKIHWWDFKRFSFGLFCFINWKFIYLVRRAIQLVIASMEEIGEGNGDGEEFVIRERCFWLPRGGGGDDWWEVMMSMINRITIHLQLAPLIGEELAMGGTVIGAFTVSWVWGMAKVGLDLKLMDFSLLPTTSLDSWFLLLLSSSFKLYTRYPFLSCLTSPIEL